MLENFEPLSGNNNDIELDTSKKEVKKGFSIVKKNILDECPNLAVDNKSFISFDDIMKRIKMKKNKSSPSFIESNE